MNEIKKCEEMERILGENEMLLRLQKISLFSTRFSQADVHSAFE